MLISSRISLPRDKSLKCVLTDPALQIRASIAQDGVRSSGEAREQEAGYIFATSCISALYANHLRLFLFLSQRPEIKNVSLSYRLFHISTTSHKEKVAKRNLLLLLYILISKYSITYIQGRKERKEEKKCERLTRIILCALCVLCG